MHGPIDISRDHLRVLGLDWNMVLTTLRTESMGLWIQRDCRRVYSVSVLLRTWQLSSFVWDGEIFVFFNDCQLLEDCTGTPWSKLYNYGDPKREATFLKLIWPEKTFGLRYKTRKWKGYEKWHNKTEQINSSQTQKLQHAVLRHTDGCSYLLSTLRNVKLCDDEQFPVLISYQNPV